MNEKLRTILDNFSMQLHEYEEEGGHLPEEIDEIWIRLTDILMEEEV